MARTITAGIDIGTHRVKVVLGERVRAREGTSKRIIGTGVSESKGLRYGYIVNAADVTKSVSDALMQAQKKAGVALSRANISVGGVGIESALAVGVAVISRADSEITELDVERAVATSAGALPEGFLSNRTVLHTVVLGYRIDDKEVLGRPVGMKGVKLEANVHYITALEQHVNDLVHAVEEAGIEVDEVIAAPLAAGLVTLSKPQKIAGCVLADIGAETVSLVVYENDLPISLKVFPIGSTDITNDIALGLRIPLHEAQDVKHRGEARGAARKQLDEIVEARLTDIFELIESHLKKIGKNGLLPAGIIMTGGGSALAPIEELARAALKLPSQRATITVPDMGRRDSIDTSWAVAHGLALIGLSSENPLSDQSHRGRETKARLAAWIKRFLP